MVLELLYSMSTDILSLDLSTKTGWAYFDNGKLCEVGTFIHKIPGYVGNVKVHTDLPNVYPWNFLDAADEIARECVDIWRGFYCPNIVIEHTEGSKHRFSQRTLEWIHASLFRQLASAGLPNASIEVRYLLNSDWRRQVRCYVSQWPEFVAWNKDIAKIKRKAKPTKSGAKVAKVDGKIVTKWDAKKISIHIAKLAYPEMADAITTDDIADAVNMGTAAINLNIFGD